MTRRAGSEAGVEDARVPTLLRLAHQMLGDVEASVDAVCDVLSRPAGRGGTDVDDVALMRDLVSAVRRRSAAVNDEWSPLAAVPTRERTAAVVALGCGWDPDGVAEAMGTTRRRVRADVARALAWQDEPTWQRALGARFWTLEPPADLGVRCRQRRQTRRAQRVRRAIAAGAMLTAATGGVDAVARAVNAPAPLPATAHEAGLLSWPPRGELVRDDAVTRAAVEVWRASPDRPTQSVYVLYAGRVAGSRLVVLQARGDRGRPEVAVVGDAGPGSAAGLRLDLVAPLARADVPLLAIPYFGAPRAYSPDAPAPRMVRLLAAPGIDRVTYRAVLNDAAPADGLLRFASSLLVDGLSAAWTDLTGEEPATAVRAYRRRRVVFTGLLAPAEVQPRPVLARVLSPPRVWAPGPTVGAETAAGDALWWAQYCGRPSPVVRPVWSGGQALVASSVRLELVRCTPTSWLAGFLSGPGDAPRLLDLAVGTADVYVARIRSPGDPMPGALLAIGSARVARIVVGSHLVSDRREVTDVRGGTAAVTAYDARGRRLTVL